MLDDCLYLRALRGESVPRPPVWFMRQAGRYLPEYRELRKRHRMLELISTPALAAEVTLQPLKRFDLDAAIIFADILNPLIGMGIDLDFVEGEGPKIFNPVRCMKDVERLQLPDVMSSASYTLEAIELCTAELTRLGVPLIGFAGAPFTVSAYLIEGGKLDRLERLRRFMLSERPAWDLLQRKLAAFTAAYLSAQARAGAASLQLFDSWAGTLNPHEYEEFAAPYIKIIITELRRAVDRPITYFSTSIKALLPSVAALGVDAISIDSGTELAFARETVGGKIALQGNLDPLLMKGSAQELERAARRTLMEGIKAAPFVFNLGHGILPETPPENVKRVVEIVRGG